LGQKSLWADEAYYARIAGDTPETVVFAAKNDFHPPGYLLAQHVMVSVFGSSEFAVRLLSALGWLAVVVLTWLWGTKVLDPKIGWAAGLWAALSYFGLITACNATSYALFGGLSVAALFAFWWAAEGRGGVIPWILFALAQTACVYAHHYGWGTFAAVNLYFLVTAKGRRKQWLPWLITNAAILVLYLPILSTTVQQTILRSDLLEQIRPGGEGLRTIVQRIVGSVYHLGAGYVFHGPNWGKVITNPLFWVTAIFVYGMAIGGVVALAPKTRPALFLGIFLVVQLVGMTRSQADVLSFPNLAPVFGLLAASAAVKWMDGRWWAAMIPLWIINGFGYGIFSSGTAPVLFSNTDFRAVAQRVEAEIELGEIVMTNLGKTGTAAFEYYYAREFVARDHFDEYKYELWLPHISTGRFQPENSLVNDLKAAFENDLSGVWYIVRFGLDKEALEPMQAAKEIFSADLWSDNEMAVAKFYPKHQ
jgi:hypothetical protein